MEKTIKIGKNTIVFDVDELISEFSRYEWDEDYNTHNDECGEDYSMSKEEWETAKEEFLNELRTLENDTQIENLFSRLYITKAGKLAKNRKNVFLSSNITMNYDNEYGSHSYDTPSIVAVDYGDVVRLRLVEVSHQDSF